MGQRVDGTRVFWQTRTFGGGTRTGGPAPHVQPWKVKPSPPCSPCFESMSPFFRLFWKYEPFVPLVLKVWGLFSPFFKVLVLSSLFFGSMFWKFEPFVSYLGIKLLKSFNPGLLFHHLLSIWAFQSWASFHWKWRYDVILIKKRRHDRSHLRVDTWEEDRRKVESSMFVCFKFQSINLSSFVCEPVFFSCSWSSRLNLVVIMQCLVR